MFNIDFTNLLHATLPAQVGPPNRPELPREQLVKFNNSWVLVGRDAANANLWRYLVAYRALAYKVENEANEWVFADPAPTFPGQPGTAWAAAWAGPDGLAIEEGVVPPGRGQRYFDGIGIAQIVVNAAPADPNARIVVEHDIIIANSDGYEDPRIFRVGDAYFLHAHRYQPSLQYGAPAPGHRVYGGYPPARLPVTPADDTALFVKVIQLENPEGNPARGNEYFFGSNVSTTFEKNYGFFYDANTLHAVYGVAPNNRPFTILRAVPGQGDIQAAPTIPGRFLVEEFQPNTDPPNNNPRDCFLHIEELYRRLIPGPSVVKCSSSGPLIWNQLTGRWLGTGHVATMYSWLSNYVCQILQAVVAIAPTMGDDDAPTTIGMAYNRLVDSEEYCTQAAAALAAAPQITRPYVANYLSISRDVEVTPNQVTDADLAKFCEGIAARIFATSLWNRTNEAAQLKQGTVRPWMPAPGEEEDTRLANPREVNPAAVLHPNRFYYSFFYELEADTYQLRRFSNAFLVYDGGDPHFLQFAANLAPFDGGYLMGFGEDDNRAKVFVMNADEYENLVNAHGAVDFDPALFEFQLLPVAQTILQAE